MIVITLSVLLESICQISTENDKAISGLALNSRLVKPGDLFFACKGTHLDGRQFIDEAIAKGASAIIAEADTDNIYFSSKNTIPIISIPHLNRHLGFIVAKYYGDPAKYITMIGITGTNGKTSCSHFIASALNYLNINCGVIGTLGNGLYGNIQPGDLTTPDVITLHATLANFLRLGVKAVAMEVSSHSLDQGRVNGIPFTVGVYTNLTRDHLDYHGNMQTYGDVKKRLFDNPLTQHVVVNQDDALGREIIEKLAGYKDIVAYSTTKPTKTSVPVVYAENVKLTMQGLNAIVRTPWGGGELDSAVIGDFNLSNVLAVLATLCMLNVSFQDALQSLSKLKSVPGRMQVFGGYEQPLVIVDYAHTPDALLNALKALRQHCNQKLYCVFGCGGDRDKGKRPMMAKIVEQYADYIILTDDNPRHESPEIIITEIMDGFIEPKKIKVQHDRSKAIADTIQSAVPGDCILIAGKGAEAYQQIGDKKFVFSDIQKVQESLGFNEI
jgi:UDP-N-acetylmuramoyl-L-alanyl-D-glutamate--2,6-diaminopimelate ligase